MTAEAGAVGDRVYAVSPSLGTLVALDADPRGGGFTDRGCFSATARPGCTTVPALAGASDVAATRGTVFVAARDSDAVVAFQRTEDGLTLSGCAAAALAGCTPAPALDAPTALAVTPFGGDLWVVSSDSVALLDIALNQRGCIEQGAGTPGGCSGGRALADPRDVAVAGRTAIVASAGSDGVALLTAGAPSQAADETGCVTEGGAEGCTPGSGLAGAVSVATHRDTAYVGAAGAGAVTSVHVPADGAPARLASVTAPTAALALPGDHMVADAPSYAGSHLYAGGAGIAPFARDFLTGALSPLAGPALRPAGAVAGLTVSGDVASTAVYAAVPSAGAVLAFARNIPPDCSGGFAPSLAPVVVGADVTAVPTRCSDANGDPLSYTVVTPPARGELVGFAGNAALYRAPAVTEGGPDSFTVRASDGGASALALLDVELTPRRGEPPPPPAAGGPAMRILDRRVRMDRRGRVTLRVRCHPATGATCRVTLSAGGARRAAVLQRDRTRRIRVRLRARIRRSVRRARAKGVLVRVTLTGRDAAGRTGRATRRIRVRARRSP